MRRRSPPVHVARAFVSAALIGVLVLGAHVLDAHVPKDLVGTQVKLVFFEDRIDLVLDLGYRDAWAQAEMNRMDADGDAEVEVDEADAWAAEIWKRKVLRQGEAGAEPALRCAIDGRPVAITLRKTRHESLVGRVFPAPFTVYYSCAVEVPDGGFRPGATHEIEVVDTVTRGDVDGRPGYLIPFSGHGNDPTTYRFNPQFLEPPPEQVAVDGFGDQYVALETERLVLRFDFAERLDRLLDGATATTAASDGEVAGDTPQDAGAGAAAGVPRDVAAASATDETARPTVRSVASTQSAQGSGPWLLAAFASLAFLWGALGSRARALGEELSAGATPRSRSSDLARDLAVVAVGAAAIVGLHLLKRTPDGSIEVGAAVVARLVAGVLLVALGLVSFWRRLRTPGANVGAECFATLFVGFHHVDRLFDALLPLAAFCAGAATLRLARRSAPARPSDSPLPVAAALSIAALGAFLAVRTLARHADDLRAFAQSLGF